MHIFYHVWDVDVVVRHVEDDMVLTHPDAGDAWQISQLVAVLIPYLREMVQVLFRLP